MGLRERMKEAPGPKGQYVREPEFQVGDRVKVNPEHRELAIEVPKLEPDAIYIVTKIRTYNHRSCRLDKDKEDGCAMYCEHFAECEKADDEIYADYVFSQILTVTLSDIPIEGLGSCWFIEA